jgi:hypothetical protein
MKLNPATKILTLLCALICFQKETNASNSCFSFIPYANNNLFVQLPEDESFCFHYTGAKIHMSTNLYGGRIIEGTRPGREIIAFGESQLLGLDFSDNKKGAKHDLSVLFPSTPITIYAAPNNGPLQALHQMKKIHQIKPITDKTVVIGFNYSTDIFRIQKDWEPERFVPLTMPQLKRSFIFPGYHDVMLFIARMRGVKFGSTVSNAEAVRQFYIEVKDVQRQHDIDNWLYNLNSSEIKFAAFKHFVLYPPYWYVGAGDRLKAKIESDYFALACKAEFANIFDSIFVAQLPDENTELAADNRHFLSGALTFRKFSC